MNGTPDDQARWNIGELHSLFVHLVGIPPEGRTHLIEAAILHPAFQAELHRLGGAVLKRAGRCHELRADIVQEAICLVIQQLESPSLQYVDEGADRFSGWLRTVLKNALRQAWRRHRQETRRRRLTADLDAMCAPQASAAEPKADQDDLWRRVLLVIHEIEDRVIHETMRDWAAGMTGAESAERRGVSRSTISKRRSRGLGLIRQRLGTA